MWLFLTNELGGSNWNCFNWFKTFLIEANKRERKSRPLVGFKFRGFLIVGQLVKQKRENVRYKMLEQ